MTIYFQRLFSPLIKKKRLDIDIMSRKAQNKQLVKVTQDMDYREFFKMRMGLLVRLHVCNNFMLEEFIESRKLQSKIQDLEASITTTLTKQQEVLDTLIQLKRKNRPRFDFNYIEKQVQADNNNKKLQDSEYYLKHIRFKLNTHFHHEHQIQQMEEERREVIKRQVVDHW